MKENEIFALIEKSLYVENVTNVYVWMNIATVVECRHKNIKFAFDVRGDFPRVIIRLVWRSREFGYQNKFRLIQVCENSGKFLEIFNEFFKRVILFIETNQGFESISFEDIATYQGGLKCTVISNAFGFQTEENIFFESEDIEHLSNVNIAVALLATVKGYKTINIDLPLDLETQSDLREIFNVKFSGEIKRVHMDSNKKNIGLLFSGGVDSLAASCLMPAESLKLVAIDYGKFYEREKNFFSQFNPHILRTNVRQSGYFIQMELAHPPAFSVAPLLLDEKLKFKQLATGDIFEASQELNCAYLAKMGFPSKYINAGRIFPVMGLTEVGTSIICRNNFSLDVIKKNVDCAEEVGTLKRYRKELLFNAVGVPVEKHRIQNPVKFGSDFTSDFLSLYLIKKLGLDETTTFVYDIPKEVREFVSKNRLEFYDKYNIKAISAIGDFKLQNDILGSIIKHVDLYTIEDFKELDGVCALLMKYHSRTKKHLFLFD